MRVDLWRSVNERLINGFRGVGTMNGFLPTWPEICVGSIASEALEVNDF